MIILRLVLNGFDKIHAAGYLVRHHGVIHETSNMNLGEKIIDTK